MKKLIALSFIMFSCWLFSFGQSLDTMFTSGQSSTYSSNVRGYWFVAPYDFVITKLYVPTDASSGNQSIAVMKMHEVATWTNTTNNFSLLYLVQDTNASGWINVYIPVSTGDSIGVLGCRADKTSYGSAGTVSFGNTTITLGRFGMQHELRNTAPKNLWTESNGSIGRIFFEFCTGSCLCNATVSVTNASSPTSNDGSISLPSNYNDIRYLRWATKEGINYPSSNDGDITGLAPGNYTLFLVSKVNEPCYLGPVTVGP